MKQKFKKNDIVYWWSDVYINPPSIESGKIRNILICKVDHEIITIKYRIFGKGGMFDLEQNKLYKSKEEMIKEL